MSELQVYLSGRLVPAREAAVSAFDAGLLHGASTFTTMLAHKGRVFRVERHLRRLMDTCRLLGLRMGETEEQLVAATDAVLKACGLTEARMRITLTPGSVKGDGPPTTLVTAEPLPDYPRWWYERGVPVVVSSLKQMRGDPTFGYKTGCYLPRMLARQEAASKGAEEALWFTPEGQLAEACFCSVFLVLKGAVRTPALDTPVLPGVVRDAVIELCGRLGLPCDAEGALGIREVLSADEILLTSSTMGVRPVCKVEAHPVGEGGPGPLTRRIMEAYRELVDRECA